MIFDAKQIDKLFLRLRQTKEELLYDFRTQRVERYSLVDNGGNTLTIARLKSVLAKSMIGLAFGCY